MADLLSQVWLIEIFVPAIIGIIIGLIAGVKLETPAKCCYPVNKILRAQSYISIPCEKCGNYTVWRSPDSIVCDSCGANNTDKRMVINCPKCERDALKTVDGYVLCFNCDYEGWDKGNGKFASNTQSAQNGATRMANATASKRNGSKTRKLDRDVSDRGG